jgi:hypothetical protein
MRVNGSPTCAARPHAGHNHRAAEARTSGCRATGAATATIVPTGPGGRPRMAEGRRQAGQPP